MHSIDQALLKKYDIHGPRYTSYPTALQFSEQFTAQDYYEHVQQSNEDPIPKPLSLYIHIPFCQSLCYYCGCHKIVTQNTAKARQYLDALEYEIELQARNFNKDRQVKQIHLGGGTPTYLQPQYIQQLLQTIAYNFNIGFNDTEIAIEIDPRTCSTDDIKALAEFGFNRMSFGIQDFNRQVQVAINRLQDAEHTLAVIHAARQSGVASISVDLMYGLPKQTLTSFTETLTAVLNARPDRIALYNYAHMPLRIKSQRLIEEKDLPSADLKLELLSQAIKTLEDAGYVYIGMDHFALPTDPLNQHLQNGHLQRNFQGYSTHGDCDITGFGLSAISRINDAYSQNNKDLRDYLHNIQANQLPIERGYILSRDDQIRAEIIQQIMCNDHINFQAFSTAQHIDFKDYFQQELVQLQALAEDGLLTIADHDLQITPHGRLLLRSIAMVFDRYLSQHKDQTVQTFSKVL